MTRYAADFQEAVRLASLGEGLTAATAARHGVPLATLRAWQKRDEANGKPWFVPPLPLSKPLANPAPMQPAEEINQETLVANLLKDYLQIHMDALESLKKEVADPLKRVDALSRLSQALDRTMRALGRASPELSRLSLAKDLLDRQAEFVQGHFPQHLAAFLEILAPFAAELAKYLAAR